MWIEIYPELLSLTAAAVTPFAGVWIEIVLLPSLCYIPAVTPFAGVWIEIRKHIQP